MFTPWHPCRMAPEGTVKWGQKEEGGMPVKKHSKFQASLLLPPPWLMGKERKVLGAGCRGRESGKSQK